MTRPQTRPYGVIAPSTRQPLLEAMLRAFCWLVSNVVSKFRTIFKRTTRDWHTGDADEVQLPKSDDIQKETFSAENTGASKALMVSSTQSVRPSNHEGVLTSGSVSHGHALPAPAGIQAELKPCPALRLQSRTRVKTIPGFRSLILSLSKDVGMSGCCLELLQVSA